MPKHKARYTFYCMTSSVDGIWHVYVILQKKNKQNFLQKLRSEN